MRRYVGRLLTIGGMALPLLSQADTCAMEDFRTFVSGKDQCLVMRYFGSDQPKTLVVWLHGDVSSGGPANYHFAPARRSADELIHDAVASVALVRPGYPDGEGNTSSVSSTDGGRKDHYTANNMTEVATAIRRLKDTYRPERVFLVGHSGGAATAAVMLGMFPGLTNGAVLVACPCDLGAWRSGRSAWSASENPIKWASHVPVDASVYALTGEWDDNTSTRLAQDYVAALNASGVHAEFLPIPRETHNGAFRSPEVSAALRKLVVAP